MIPPKRFGSLYKFQRYSIVSIQKYKLGLSVSSLNGWMVSPEHNMHAISRTACSRKIIYIY